MKTMLMCLLGAAVAFAGTGPVRTGADRILDSHIHLIKGKRIGLVTNHTALRSDGVHLADALASRKDVTLAALFGPEHGVRGDAPDGRTIRDTVDASTGVPVYSLYGSVNKPTPEMLKGVDVLMYDIQDVGARFYTYISTMFLAMEAAAEQGIPIIVLDRPNPITGVRCEGPMRVDSLKTFVGWAPMPTAHGLTVGELAEAANREGWLKDGMKAKLTVVPMEGWKRSMWYDQTGLRWVKPSPNMSTLATAVVYPGLCIIEGLNVSEGRGTERPFETFGAPWMNGEAVAKLLNDQGLPGVRFSAAKFTPREIPFTASRPKYQDRECSGVSVTVTDRNAFEPVRTGVAVVWALHRLHPDSLKFRDRGFDRLMGTPAVRERIVRGEGFQDIVKDWRNGMDSFAAVRKAVMLYGDK